MATIREFVISGLAGRRKAVSHRLSDVSVFWGLNGSGKTSLLKILHSALTGDATPLVRVPFTAASVTIAAGRGDSEIFTREIVKSDLVEADAVQLAMGDDEDQDAQFWRDAVVHETLTRMPRWRTKPPTEERSRVAIRHGYLPISRVSETRARRGRHRSTTDLIDEATFDRLFAEQVQDLWIEYNQRALTQIRFAQERGLAGILNSVLQGGRKKTIAAERILDSHEAYELLKDFLSGQQRIGGMVKLSQDAFSKNYASDSLLQQVVAQVADVQRGIELAQQPQRRIEELLADLYSGGKQVSLQGRQVAVQVRGKQIPLESLSSGEKQMLQLLLECLAAGANPVIIDEPELSLHVDWQNRLVKSMRTVNEDAQLIMATHSPEVMANLSDKVIIEL